jgi:hypothetical protein
MVPFSCDVGEKCATVFVGMLIFRFMLENKYTSFENDKACKEYTCRGLREKLNVPPTKIKLFYACMHI